MFWVGKHMPWWVPRCMESYLWTGHAVFWWLYPEERASDVLAPAAGVQECTGGISGSSAPSKVGARYTASEADKSRAYLHHRLLFVRDANDIIPYARAQRMFYHGMDEHGKWRGWAPFSDWFRCEVLQRFGGWWVDADSVSVRNLRHLRAGWRDRGIILCTERHRRDRRRIGAVSVHQPGRIWQEDRCGAHSAFFSGSMAEFHDWFARVEAAGSGVGLISNSHFWAPRGSPFVAGLAAEMRRTLNKYATQVERMGVPAIRTSSQSALPNSVVGMQLFQQAVRRAVRSRCEPVQVLHWSVFNPVDATDADRMMRVLSGREALCGAGIRSIHVFGKIRTAWKQQQPPRMWTLIMPTVIDDPGKDCNDGGDELETAPMHVPPSLGLLEGPGTAEPRRRLRAKQPAARACSALGEMLAADEVPPKRRRRLLLVA